MNEARKEALIRKYSYAAQQAGAQGKGPGGPRPGGPGPGRGRGRMSGGKPKNAGKTIKRLLSYIQEEKYKLALVFTCVIINTIAMLAGSYMLRPIINSLTSENGSADKLLHSLVIMACIYAVGIVAQYLQSRVMIGISQHAIFKIRNELFAKIQKLPVRFYDTNNHGDIMSRFTNDVDTIGNMLSSTLVQLFSGALSIVGTLGLMLYTNVYLTVITLVLIPMMLKAGGAVASRSQKYFNAQQSALGALNGYIEETISGQKAVKVFCHEDVAEEEFEILNSDLKDKQIRAQFLGGMMGPVMNNLSQINYVLTACVGGLLCVIKNFDVGGLAVFLNFSRQFSRPVNEISMQVSNVFSALAGAERVFAVMDEEPEPEDDPDAVSMEGMKGHVSLEHVYFGYDPGKLILKDISLYARPGQKIAFVGSTGAGKTTITNLLNRF